jgi:hypothetical protein
MGKSNKSTTPQAAIPLGMGALVCQLRRVPLTLRGTAVAVGVGVGEGVGLGVTVAEGVGVVDGTAVGVGVAEGVVLAVSEMSSARPAAFGVALVQAANKSSKMAVSQWVGWFCKRCLLMRQILAVLKMEISPF